MLAPNLVVVKEAGNVGKLAESGVEEAVDRLAPGLRLGVQATENVNAFLRRVGHLLVRGARPERARLAARRRARLSK